MRDKSYWGATRKVLLVVNYTSLDEVHAFRNAIKSVGLNVNDCVLLALVPSKKEQKMLTEIHSVVYASEKEINLLGQWKNESLQKSLNHFYDLVLVIGAQGNKAMKHIKKVKNTISVGVNTNTDFLTVQLHSEDNSPEHLLNFVKRTLEKII